MTNFIEQMIETAGVNLIAKYPNLNFTEVPNDFSKSQYIQEEYPAFTAEKQLEIIKLIGFNSSFNLVINKFGCSPTTEDKYRLTFSENRGFKIFQSFNPDFTHALAQLTTELMRAGELDKEKVKEILENE